MIGKAEDDAWVNHPAVIASLREVAELAGPGARDIYWGMMETYHWNESAQRPFGFHSSREFGFPVQANLSVH